RGYRDWWREREVRGARASRCHSLCVNCPTPLPRALPRFARGAIMTISEQSRHDLYQRLEEALGAPAAATLMEHLPPVGWADVATKRDLDALRAATKGDLDALEHRLRADFRADSTPPSPRRPARSCSPFCSGSWRRTRRSPASPSPLVLCADLAAAAPRRFPPTSPCRKERAHVPPLPGRPAPPPGRPPHTEPPA